MPDKILQEKQYLRLNQIFSLCVLVIAYFTYFSAYEYPARLIWDEHFYLTDAQRYLSGVMFMEMHPPLGKQLIALGEWLFQPNAMIDLSAFLELERISSVPEGYSFKGVRFFPTLLSTLSAVLFFWILVNISRQPLLSFLFSSLYLFDNALIVQSRAAMLDGPQIFFAFATLLFFIYRLNKQLKGERNHLSHYFILGLLIGLCSAIRYTGLILILLIPFWSFALWKIDKTILNQSIIKKWLVLLLHSISSFTGILLVMFLTFYIHFSLGKTVANNTFNASPQYLKSIANAEQSELKNFIPLLVENVLFSQNYNQGVRSYKACMPGENGSLVISWPLMNKSIRYLADRSGSGEPGKGVTKYLYLHGNPIIWYSALWAVFLSISLLCSKYFFSVKIIAHQQNTKKQQWDLLISVFSLMYVSYLLVLLNMDRVFYLYHYLFPLYLGLCLFFILFNEIFEHSLQSKSPVFYLIIFIFCIEIFFSYWFFSPLTYYQPLSLEEFHQRQWFDFWSLRPLP